MLLAIAAGVCSLALAGPAAAAIYTVDDLSDVHDSEFPGPFTDGVCDASGADGCTLRAALEEANNAAVGTDTINISVAGTINLALGQLILADDPTVNGNAGGTTIDAGSADRVLSVSSSAVTLNDLIVQGGAVTDSPGAGIFSTADLLTLNRVTVTGNTLDSAGGGYSGGGIATQTSAQALVLNDSTVSDNEIIGVSGLGGGISARGPLTLNRSTVSGNDSTLDVGGRGGGIDANPGSNASVTIRNSTISGNDSGNGGGGGLMATGNATPVVIEGSTFAGNTTTGSGGALRTFGTTTSDGSIYAFNTATVSNPNCGISSLSGTPESNIDSDTTCGFGTSNGNQENVSAGDLALGGLADNGGGTLTRAIGPDSVALNAAVDCSGLSQDQRGRERPRGPACDIGAVELDYRTLAVSTSGTGAGTVAAAGISCPGDCSELVPQGTQVTLTPAAATGSTFTGWSGGCTGTGACNVTLDADKAVTATFTKTTPPGATPPKKCKKGQKLKKGKCVKKKKKKRKKK